MSELHLPHDHGNSKNAAIEHIPSGEDLQIVSDLFLQLGDSSRLRIFWILCHCEECVINLAALVDMSSPAVSHHLKKLKSCGLITSRRSGKEVYYKASETNESHLLHHMIEDLIEIACPQKIDPASALQTSCQTELIHKVHDLLISDLQKRYTIEELSHRYHINSSSLKSAFKAEYGLPIASYMKDYRIHRAMELLEQTEGSISEIAMAVGYETQGKFTKAFKDVAHVLPSEYRKKA